MLLQYGLDPGRVSGDSRESMFWGAVLLVGIVAIGAREIRWMERAPKAWTSEARLLLERIRPETQLYTDMLGLRVLEFLSGYPKSPAWVDFDDLEIPATLPAGSYVLVNKAYIAWLNRNKGMWLSKSTGYREHGFYSTPPDTWRKLFDNGNAALYEVQ
jgi:hypothetical protein